MCYNPLNGVGQSGNGEKNQKKQVSHTTKEKYFRGFIKGEIRRLSVPLAFLVSALLVILNLRVVSPCIRLYICRLPASTDTSSKSCARRKQRRSFLTDLRQKCFRSSSHGIKFTALTDYPFPSMTNHSILRRTKAAHGYIESSYFQSQRR